MQGNFSTAFRSFSLFFPAIEKRAGHPYPG
jgi:hypothetical protein